MEDNRMIDGYPAYMRESIKKVAATRPSRIGKLAKAMTMEERKEVLSMCHPDYAAGSKTKLKIGPNEGDMAPYEVADLLEAYPLISKNDIDLEKIDYEPDLLIIGGGLAGISAALLANDNGIPAEKILLVNKLRLGDSNSVMAQGGTQAADRPNDSPVTHFLDAMGGGHFTNKPDVLRALVTEAPIAIKWLSDLGVMFDRDEKNEFIELHGGGTTRKRMHACKDYTGLEEVRVIRDEFRNRKIPCLEFHPAIELLTDPAGGKVTGAVIYSLEAKNYFIVKAKATVLATGGFGRLHIRGFPTTNHYGATADGLVLAYRAGAKLRDIDTVQYHPTGAAYPQQIVGLLLTEKLRTSGGQPCNVNGEAFVNPLEPRDVESAAFIRECYVNNLGVTTPTGMKGIWLDTPLLEMKGEGATEREFPGMYRMFKRFGIDMAKDPVLVFPTLHYQNGGVETEPDTRTNLEGLFVAGEVSGGVHGKNRLMGNSTLDCLVFGRLAGIASAKYIHSYKGKAKISLQHIEKYEKMLKEAGIKKERKSPILFPDYRGKAVLARMIDVF